MNAVEKLLEWWISSVSDEVKSSKELGLIDFSKKYCKLLETTRNQISRIADDLRMIDKALRDKPRDIGRIMPKYIDAISVDIEGRKVFIPSFADECLIELTRLSGLFLSPFRGLLYASRLGTMAYEFERQNDDSAVINFLTILDQLNRDKKRQNFKLAEYNKYLNSLKSKRAITKLKMEIKQFKSVLRTLIIKPKQKWTTFLTYETRTATHFYMSGIRFYLQPLLYDINETIQIKNERFFVHSTDSGLYQPREHYGMLLESQDPEAIDELMIRLPPGCLSMDIWTEQATKDDLMNLQYWEEWSRLITSQCARIVNSTLDLIDGGYSANARHFFLNSLTKNPMRKFYFDMGIWQAAKLAARGDFPKVSYVTTRSSQMPRVLHKKGKEILLAFLEETSVNGVEGIEYYRLDEIGWPGKYQRWHTLTLVPTKNLSKYTNVLLSNRDIKTRKITQGCSFHAASMWLALTKAEFKNIKLEDIVPFILLPADIGMISIASTAIPLIGRMTRARFKLGRIKRDILDANFLRTDSKVTRIGRHNVDLLCSPE